MERKREGGGGSENNKRPKRHAVFINEKVGQRYDHRSGVCMY